MKTLQTLFIIVSIFVMASCASFTTMKEGDTLWTKTNIHTDLPRRAIHTMNYQTDGGLIPMCSKVFIKEINSDTLVFTWQGVDYTLVYEKYTNRAGISFERAANNFVSQQCESDKVAVLSALDKEGIEQGKPLVGMSRAGVFYAMGRPPHHANPHLEVESWLYWRNKHRKIGIDFNDNGQVKRIR